jgi:DNA-binding transcriptional MerR regulator
MNNATATFITSSEMARLTGLPQTTVTWHANNGTITPIRDNTGRRLYTREDAAKLIAFCEAKVAKEAARKAQSAGAAEAAAA